MYKYKIFDMPTHFDTYINCVPDIQLEKALIAFGTDYLHEELSNFERIGHQIYQPGKWTIPDILQHLIDTERIFTYRALRFARNDHTLLPGFDEQLFAENGHATNRSCKDLLYEFELLRASTLAMFNSFNEDDLKKEGVCFQTKISVLALGFTIVGHPIHHLHVIKEKYFPLLTLG